MKKTIFSLVSAVLLSACSFFTSAQSALFVPQDIKEIPDVYDTYWKKFLPGKSADAVWQYFLDNHIPKEEMERIDFKRSQVGDLHARQASRIIKGETIFESEAGKAIIMHGIKTKGFAMVNRVSTSLVTLNPQGQHVASLLLCEVDLDTGKIWVNSTMSDNKITVQKTDTRGETTKSRHYVNPKMFIYND